MSVSTMSAYGRTWPLIVTPVLYAKIRVRGDVDPSRPTEDQAFELEARLLALLPDAEHVQVEEVHDHRLSPADQIEHDRLADEAMRRAA